MDGLCHETEKIIENHLRRRGIWKDEKLWEVGKSRFSGRGVYATRDIQPGEIIFVDSPVILGPRAIPENTCVSCYNDTNIVLCPMSCGLYLCPSCLDGDKHSQECAKINSWKTEKSFVTDRMMICLAPIRSLFLDDSDRESISMLEAHREPQHGIEVDLMKKKMLLELCDEEENWIRLTCAVLDANSFEVLPKTGPTLRGLFPLSSLLNHSCVPNVMHVFDEDHHMILKAAKPIKKGEEIFLTYSRILWCTLSRRTHLLRTKHFACECPRCHDPTEFGTNLSAMLCESCSGFVLPKNPLIFNGVWTCNSCDRQVEESKIAFIMSVLAKRFSDVDEDHMKSFDLFRSKSEKIIPKCNQVSLEFMYRTIWILGGAELSDEHFQIKGECLKYVLDVLMKLDVGASKMRGLLLHELYKCQKELISRGIVMDEKFNEDEILEEAAEIYMFDVSAPEIIKNVWKKKNLSTDWNDYFF
ncbi:PREDICTED: protein msta-like [Nicrophorus vespilloides]|uniref:Protein msta-like n=1 Tax=Nicrophorus vespilloides TaxID=110193 RepID=A0ABM1M234_NICVS|nr:PREDICTED: protein msta-like [Nicrophorus vespilloides]